jgi:chromate transporter
MEKMTQPPRVRLADLALSFLKLGTIAFGGPAAHIAMMENEFVDRKQWITRPEFLDRLAAANLIPGPSSTEVAIFIGYAKRGWKGLLVAGCCFILPAAILVTLIAAAYVRFGSLPQVAGMLYTIKPVVIAIILQALWKLARSAVKSAPLAIIGVGSAILSFYDWSPILVLALAGTTSLLLFLVRKQPGTLLALMVFPSVVVEAAPRNQPSAHLLRLFLSFLKIGFVVFGSGYVLLAFLRTEFINHLHWLTEKQLIDAVAVGQFTPGPVFTTATFIGYLVAGIPGAVFATIAIFLPGFLLVSISGPLIAKIRSIAWAGSVLDGVVIGSLALLCAVAFQLGRSAVIDWMTVSILITSLIAVFLLRLNAAWLIAAAAIIGLFLGH